MSLLNLRAKETCRWDLVSLGEVMLRLDPGEDRVHTARSFRAWEGGGEYNVARGLRRCFGQRTAIVTALADNPVGRLLEDLMLQGGVDTSLVRFVPYDGVGRSARNGLNFTERGFGPRGAVGCSDRGHSAVAGLRPGDLDFQQIFGQYGSRWLHTGGIFAALSPSTPEVAALAIRAAREHGSVVSYDLNYRPSLWQALGGPARAREVNRELVKHVDVLFGNEEDFDAALGFEGGAQQGYAALSLDGYRELLGRVAHAYPNLSVIATSLRVAGSASSNAWGGLLWARGELHEVAPQEIPVLDRVGGGDSFASGIAYGLLSAESPAFALRCGVAHGALAMSTPGDTSTASLAEVKKLMAGASARIER
jgi:2-dehydro-3-deoxygluconokinase